MMPIILMDFDGVICNSDHRAHLVPPPEERHRNSAWKPYVAECGGDSVIPAGLELYKVISKMHFVTIVTSRQVAFETQTKQWWRDNTNLPQPNVLYRPNGNHDTPAEYKRWRLHQLRKDGYQIITAIDDDPEVIAMYQEEGVMTFMASTKCASLKG